MLQKIRVPSSSQSSLIGLLDSEDDSTTVLHSVRNFKPKDTALHPTRLEYSATLL